MAPRLLVACALDRVAKVVAGQLDLNGEVLGSILARLTFHNEPISSQLMRLSLWRDYILLNEVKVTRVLTQTLRTDDLSIGKSWLIWARTAVLQSGPVRRPKDPKNILDRPIRTEKAHRVHFAHPEGLAAEIEKREMWICLPGSKQYSQTSIENHNIHN